MGALVRGNFGRNGDGDRPPAEATTQAVVDRQLSIQIESYLQNRARRGQVWGQIDWRGSQWFTQERLGQSQLLRVYQSYQFEVLDLMEGIVDPRPEERAEAAKVSSRDIPPDDCPYFLHENTVFKRIAVRLPSGGIGEIAPWAAEQAFKWLAEDNARPDWSRLLRIPRMDFLHERDRTRASARRDKASSFIEKSLEAGDFMALSSPAIGRSWSGKYDRFVLRTAKIQARGMGLNIEKDYYLKPIPRDVLALKPVEQLIDLASCYALAIFDQTYLNRAAELFNAAIKRAEADSTDLGTEVRYYAAQIFEQHGRALMKAASDSPSPKGFREQGAKDRMKSIAARQAAELFGYAIELTESMTPELAAWRLKASLMTDYTGLIQSALDSYIGVTTPANRSKDLIAAAERVLDPVAWTKS